MFLNLWAQVWVLQLLKERRLANASGESYPLAAAALAVAVANAWWALWRRRRLVGARALLAVAGLWYLAARGSSSNHIALQAVVCVAVLVFVQNHLQEGVPTWVLGVRTFLILLCCWNGCAEGCLLAWLPSTRCHGTHARRIHERTHPSHAPRRATPRTHRTHALKHAAAAAPPPAT